MRRADRENLFNLDVNRPWTRDEDNYLLFRCEKYTVSELAERLNRTIGDTGKRLRLLGLEPSCGVYSLTKACRETGYATSQLERARTSLNMVWRKNSEGRFAITEEQLTEMCEYLKTEV